MYIALYTLKGASLFISLMPFNLADGEYEEVVGTV